MKASRWIWGPALLLFLGAQGCGTILNLTGDNYHPTHVPPPSHPQIFGGARTTAGYLFCDREGADLDKHWCDRSILKQVAWIGYGTVLFFLDLPASLALDTVLLPVTIPFELFGESPAPTPKELASKP